MARRVVTRPKGVGMAALAVEPILTVVLSSVAEVLLALRIEPSVY